jgi:hypothetical protein
MPKGKLHTGTKGGKYRMQKGRRVYVSKKKGSKKRKK